MNTRALLLLASLMAPFLFSSCSKDSRQIIVVLDSDYTTPTELDQIEVAILSESDAVLTTHTFALDTERPLPLSFGVAPVGGDPQTPFIVSVRALGPAMAGYPVIRRRVQQVPEGANVIAVFITRACAGQMCPDGQTCVVDACRAEAVGPAETFKVVEPGTELARACVPGSRRCAPESNAVVECVAFGMVPKIEACGVGSSCVPDPARCDGGEPTDFMVSVSITGTGMGAVASTPGMIDCAVGRAGRCADQFPSGSTVQFRATPALGSRFVSWGDDCAFAESDVCSIEIGDNLSISARFEPNDVVLHRLTVLKAGTAAGLVASTISPGIDCGGACTFDFPVDTTVTLQATPAAGALFGGWSVGECAGTGDCVLTMDGPKSVTATFNPPPVGNNLFVTVLGQGEGNVSSDDGSIDCGTFGSDCDASFPGVATTLVLTATPEIGSRFVGWTGCTGNLTDCTVLVDGFTEVSARFEPDVPPSLGQSFDLNGDLIDDLVFAAPGFTPGAQTSAGRVYVFLGPIPTGMSLSAAAADRMYDGIGPGDRLGSSLVVGDVTGDGQDDLIMGAPGAMFRQGVVFVVPGSTSLPASGAVGAAGFSIQGPVAMSDFGQSITVVPDQNGDTFSDLLVGAPGSNEAFLFYAGATFGMTAANMANVRFTSVAGGGFGFKVSSIGDVDDDGDADIAISAPTRDDVGVANNAGRVYLFDGPYPSTVFASTADVTIDGELTDHQLGFALTGMGDIDGDFIDDFAVGTNNFDDVYIFSRGSLNAGDPLVASEADYYESRLGRFGSSLAGAGDINLDGNADLLVGAPVDRGMANGAAYMFSGDGNGSSPPYTQRIIQGGACSVGGQCVEEQFGTTVGPVGDVNDDGVPDFAVGSNWGGGSAGPNGRGRVAVFFGSTSLPPPTPPLISDGAGLLIECEAQASTDCGVLPVWW